MLEDDVPLEDDNEVCSKYAVRCKEDATHCFKDAMHTILYLGRI